MKYIEKHPYVFLGLCALVLFLAANSFLAITDSAESNYALTAKEMVLSGDWLSPQIYGHYWYHHCLPDQSMGFCFLANIPIAVERAKAQLGLGKVAIID